MDQIILQGLDFSNFFKEKNLNNIGFLPLNDGDHLTLNYDNNIIKLNNYDNTDVINGNGDYAISNSLLLEAICLTFLNKLNTTHFPNILNSFLCKNKLCIEQDYKTLSLPLDEIVLDDKKKDIILFQLLYALYESSSIDFSHNNITKQNISIESVPSMEVEYIIKGKIIKLFNYGINVKFNNFKHSRITVYETYIFNENDRKKKYPKEYDVPFFPSKDLYDIIKLDILSDEMKNKIENKNILNKIDNGISSYEILSILFEISEKTSQSTIINKTSNECKTLSNKDDILYSVANMTEDIKNINEKLLYLLTNNYNRLAYKLIIFYPTSVDENINYREYTKNIKLLNLIYNTYNNYLNLDNKDNIYDPIMLKYYSKKEWLDINDNIIINSNKHNYGTNKKYFNMIPRNNLINEVIFDNYKINYLKTFKNKQYIDLNKYGINAIINYQLFKIFLESKQYELNLADDNENIDGINYEFLINSYQSKGYKFLNAFTENQIIDLTNYTYQWDNFINGYLRNGENYFNSNEFHSYYTRIDLDINIAKDKIIQAIKNIDDAFLIAPILEEEIVLYRGTKDCFLYDGINLGFISTTILNNIAHRFKETKGCIYEMHISPGIPYIQMDKFSKYPVEKEILLPRNLIVTKRDQIGKNYIVDINLSSDNQFNYYLENKKYNIKTIKNYSDTFSFNHCYKNKMIGNEIIDEISGNITTDSINFNGMCYSITTLLKLLYRVISINLTNNTLVHYFADPFTRIRFSTDIIKRLIARIIDEPTLIYYNDSSLTTDNFEEELYYFFIKDGNLEIIKFLNDVWKVPIIDNFAVNISVNAGYFDIFYYFMENGNILSEIIFNSIITNDRVKCFDYLNNQVDFLSQFDLVKSIITVSLDKYSIDIINYIIDKNIDLSKYSKFFVICGIVNNDLNLINYALQNGYNLNDIDIFRIDVVVAIENIKIIKFLIDNGYNINLISTDAITSLLDDRKYSTVKFLIDNGYNINFLPKDKFKKFKEIIYFLKKNGYVF